MNTRILSLTAIGLWVVTVAVAGYFFIAGRTETASDGRQAIMVSESEKNLVLTEMRGMLASVQGILDGLSKNDMKRVAAAARPSGNAAAQHAPPALMAKLPLQFKQYAMSAHGGFDEIVVGAETGEPADMLLARLGERLINCVACHATYRLEVAASD